MKRLSHFSMLVLLVLAVACSSAPETQTTVEPPKSMVEEDQTKPYDPNRGEGKFTAENVVLGDKLDNAMVTAGDAVQGVKCAACHKLTDEKLVGPGWKDVTSRRKPEWIMNFISNPDPMIEKDPAVQAQLELCLVRMPNQGLNDDEARNILEYMLKNDK